LKSQAGKKKLPGGFNMSFVMQQCRTVDDVHALLSQYDLNALNGGMLLFADASGKYLVVEADTLIMGNDPTYVLANFCPSVTPDLSEVKIERYTRGVAFLRNHAPQPDSAYCTALSDTMHVCRSRMGDGTLYTTIYDLAQKSIRLYFYHDYRKGISFDLQQELSKGDHELSIPALFPYNSEYERLAHYRIPQYDRTVWWFMTACCLVFAFTAVYQLLLVFRKDRNGSTILPLSLVLLDGALAYYCFILLTRQQIFFLAAPYTEPGSSLINLAAYLPLLLAVLIVPIICTCIVVIRRQRYNRFARILLTINTGLYPVLLGLFIYWGLLNVL
jgi:hypothetical protein